MKTLQEFVVDNEFENFLIEDILVFLDCYNKAKNPNSFKVYESYIFEEMTQLNNFYKIWEIIINYIEKEIPHNILPEQFEKDSKFIIDVSKTNSFCNKIELTINLDDNKLETGYTKISNDGNIVSMDLTLPFGFSSYQFEIGCLIMHELLHAYEDYSRKTKGKPSIFDEWSKKYLNAKNNINSRNENVKQLATLEYMLNPKERNAYISTLELDIEKLVKKEKINPKNFRPSEILDKLKNDKTSIWKRYFDFGKFVVNINNIPNNELEEAYWKTIISLEEQSKQNKERLELLRKFHNGEIENLPQKEFQMKAKEIRNKCKNVWHKFNQKFERTFLKIYMKYLQKQYENKYINTYPI